MTTAASIPTGSPGKLWRVWIDTDRRIVSFHEEEDCRLMEFQNPDLFWSCVDQYAAQQYRYQ